MRGAKIDAQGTETDPIVFTSDQPPGSRGSGDWAGVAFNGYSTVNGPGCEFQAEGVPTPFGGCVANDSSGVATFVRATFAGLDFTPNNELNVWTQNGIGSQTDFRYIQAGVGGDDCFEWFGGTMKADHLVANACGDDGFDWQLGFTGALQFGLQIQNGQITDPGRDCRGIEADNSEYDNNATPFSDPQMCNLTLVGSARQAGANDGSDVGIMLRRGTRGQMANLIVTGYEDAGVELRDAKTTDQACVDANSDGTPESLTGGLIVRNSVFFDNGTNPGDAEHAKSGDTLTPCSGIPGCKCNTGDWYALLVANYHVVNADGSNTVDPGVDDSAYPASGELFDARPANPIVGGPAPYACSNLNPAFEDVNYIGAVDPNAPCTITGPNAKCDWMSKPWIDLDVQ